MKGRQAGVLGRILGGRIILHVSATGIFFFEIISFFLQESMEAVKKEVIEKQKNYSERY